MSMHRVAFEHATVTLRTAREGQEASLALVWPLCCLCVPEENFASSVIVSGRVLYSAPSGKIYPREKVLDALKWYEI